MGKKKSRVVASPKVFNGSGVDKRLSNPSNTRVKTKQDLDVMNVDEFMNDVFDGTDDEEEVCVDNAVGSLQGVKAFSKDSEQIDMSCSDEEADNEDDDNDDDDANDENIEDEDIEEEDDEVEGEEDVDDSTEKGNESDGKVLQNGKEENGGFSVSDHRKSLSNLRNTDPEFYKYLEENDKKLLQFNVSDSDSDGSGDEKFHKPSEDLEVGSDESDFEDDKDVGSGRVISLKILREWEEKLQTDKTNTTIVNLIDGFHAALNRVTGNEDDSKFKVAGSAVFNGVVQLCVMHLQPALVRFLRIAKESAKNVEPSKCKKWNKVKNPLKSYFLDLLKLMNGVSSSQIVSVLLKHLHQMSSLVICFPKILIKLSKKLISIWGSADDTSRILAFLCILRIVTTQHHLLASVLKQMYLTYVRNVKFTSVNTLPSINFMRRSLSEMFCVDETVSYQLMFLYVRQLAIHLRNAVTLSKRESFAAVLNWQFVHSLNLWLDVLGSDRPVLRPLLYPVVQVTLGTVKLIPTTQYYPLRLHCVRMLLSLQERTGTFVPVVPLLLDILASLDTTKRANSASMKPMELSCLLRVSKAEQHEKSFKDSLVDAVFLHVLHSSAILAHTIGYPDLVRPTIVQLRKFTKTCKVANYCRKIRSLIDKMEENARLVEERRKTFTGSLGDRKAVDAWETSLKMESLPLVIFLRGMQTVNNRAAAKLATGQDKLADFGIPTIKKRPAVQRDSTQPSGPPVLFPSDSEDDNDSYSEMTKNPQKDKKKKKKKNLKSPAAKKSKVVPNDLDGKEDDQPDILENIDMTDF